MSDLSIFKFCVVDDGMSTVVGPLLDLGSLFTLVRVSKRVHEMYYKHIVRILKEENAASRLMRACVREMHRRQGLDTKPRYMFQFRMHPTVLLYSDRFPTFNPTEFIVFFVELPSVVAGALRTYLFEVHIDTRPTDRFILVKFRNHLHLMPNLRHFIFGPQAEIPKYEGEGEDPHVRTEMNYEEGVVLNLNGRQWVGNLFYGGGVPYRQFRFHKTPNGVQHALILAGDLFHSACVYALRFNEGATAPHLKLDYGVAA
jgi:hypothetical protein